MLLPCPPLCCWSLLLFSTTFLCFSMFWSNLVVPPLQYALTFTALRTRSWWSLDKHNDVTVLLFVTAEREKRHFLTSFMSNLFIQNSDSILPELKFHLFWSEEEKSYSIYLTSPTACLSFVVALFYQVFLQPSIDASSSFLYTYLKKGTNTCRPIPLGPNASQHLALSKVF